MSLTLPNKLQTKVVKSDIQGQFDAIDTYINTTKVTSQAVEPASIEYRHLKAPVKINLMIDKDPVVVDAVSYGGWYHSDAILKHTASSNPDSSPMVLVSAMVGCTGSKSFYNNGTHPTACAIGVSTDNGATWSVLMETRRELGNGSGIALAYYDAKTQPHYLTEAGGYTPINIPSDHAVELLGTFGGEKSMGSPTAINQYCVMFDSPCTGTGGDGYWYGWAILMLDARSAT